MPTSQDHTENGLTTAPVNALEQQQRRRMITALLVLTVALILVLIKDWRVLSPPPPVATAEAVEPETVQPTPSLTDRTTVPLAPRLTPTQAARANKPSAPAPPKKPSEQPMVVTTNRAVLPPLEVEVVAGNQRHTVDAGTNSVNVRMQDGLAPPAAAGQIPAADATVSHATERVQLSPDTVQLLERPVEPTYPMLAKQMKVQGAVVLQALIGKTGEIQEIQVLSGPAILSAAAREAVRQWRFKPHFQGGKPVDSEARITVNFTISTY
jgi:protein TonB